MIKAVILLDCDECGHSLNIAAACSTSERQAWEREIGVLMHQAEWQGWRFVRDYGICPDCILEELKMADWLQEPEEILESR
jgi:hypothetical protein